MLRINPEGYDFTGKPVVADLVGKLKSSQKLDLDEAQLFVDFPLYKGVDEHLVVSQLILVSKKFGVWAFFATDANKYSLQKLKADDDELLEVANNVFSRLLRNKRLSSGFNQLKVHFSTLIYSPNLDSSCGLPDLKNNNVHQFNELEGLMLGVASDIQEVDYLECISTIQGAKGLWKPQDRNVTDFNPNSKVAKISEVESQILMFDKDQQEGYIGALSGPQRIRGLAGSGKTVVLAMKAALTLLKGESSNSRILYTFTTKSLYQHVQRLIQRFYREFDDDLSNLDRVSIKHSWGGKTNNGVYFEACQAFNHTFLTYPQAASMAPPGMDAFEFACKDLLDSVEIEPLYDYVFVDEAQDYNKYFLRLCTKLAKGKRVTFGADVFQNIFQSSVPTASEIYDDGTVFVNEKYLNVCYRTPLPVLVCAHSIGLGVYGQQVQKIETVEHWNSLGYSVIGRESGSFVENEYITISRDAEHSPTLADENPEELISLIKFANLDEEVEQVGLRILKDIKIEGLLAEDILVMCADDYRCKEYFRKLTEMLMREGVSVNNIHAEKYTINDFKIKGRVTLSTVHKAKGNEAYSVYLVGTDYLSYNLNVRNRNLIFTAFTRTKGWLTISGVGVILDTLFYEITQAQKNLPEIKFNYPTAAQVQQIEHDLQNLDVDSPADIMTDIDMYESLMKKYGSFDKMTKYIEEAKGRKGKK